MEVKNTKHLTIFTIVFVFLFLPYFAEARECEDCWCLRPDGFCEHYEKMVGTTGEPIETDTDCNSYCSSRTTDGEPWRAIHCDHSFFPIDWNSKDPSDPCFNKTVQSTSPGETPTQTPTTVMPDTPELQIRDIPVQFSKIVVSEEGGTKYITVPWLAEYIAAIYQYLVGVATILAIVMMMYGGFRWIVAGGDAGKIGEARKTIAQAAIGLVLALGSYTVLNLVNPDLVSFKALRLALIERQEFVEGLGYADPSEEQQQEYISNPATPTGSDYRSQLLSVCKPRKAEGLASAANLKAILPLWLDIGRVGGATYIRGGLTRKSKCSSNPQQSYAISIFKKYNIPYDESSSAKELKNIYQTAITDKVYADGRLCGDCVTWTQQLYECAGMGYRFRLPAMKQRKADYLQYRVGTSEQSCRDAANSISGGLKFGDVIHYRSTSGARHMVTYIGGGGFEWEVMEMGGGRSAKCQDIPGLGKLNCVRVHKSWRGWDKERQFCDIFRILE